MDCTDLEACAIINEKNLLLTLINQVPMIEYHTQSEFSPFSDEMITKEEEVYDDFEPDITIHNKDYYEQSFQRIKDNTFNFNSNKEIQKLLKEIDRDYEDEVTECVKILPQNFETARGRARCKQLQNLSPKQRKMEEKVRLIKNKYCAKKIRVKKNENLLKLESQIKFLTNKNNKYEYLFQKLLSKIK